MDRVDGGLALPALAGHFGGDGGAVFRHGFGEFLGQIKIAADTAVVGTINAEHRLGVSEIRREFDLAVLGETCGVVVPEVYCQRFQLWELVGQAG